MIRESLRHENVISRTDSKLYGTLRRNDRLGDVAITGSAQLCWRPLSFYARIDSS